MDSQQPLIEYGIAARTLPGEKESGDRHVVRLSAKGALIVVVDGVGHGREAALAAGATAAMLEKEDPSSLISMVRRCHERLHGTRGVVLSMAFFDYAEKTVTWLGIGNVEGILLHRDVSVIPSQEFLLLRGGVLGDHLPRLHASIVPVGGGDLLIFATDGIRSGYADHLDPELTPQALADRILDRNWRGTDDALVFVARFLHGNHLA